MPRFYFHVCAFGQNFRDDVGSEVGDLAAAHSRAMVLADRIMAFPCFADVPPDFRRWTVKVTDESRRCVITVIFPTYLALRGEATAHPSNDARMLLLRLDDTLSSHRGERRLGLS